MDAKVEASEEEVEMEEKAALAAAIVSTQNVSLHTRRDGPMNVRKERLARILNAGALTRPSVLLRVKWEERVLALLARSFIPIVGECALKVENAQSSLARLLILKQGPKHAALASPA